MARLAGLEPATLGLEGRCSIRLSYKRFLVGVEGFEPPTFCSQSRRATRLRYTPDEQLVAANPIALIKPWNNNGEDRVRQLRYGIDSADARIHQ